MLYQKHSVRLLLKSNKENKLGQQPIYLRITIDRKSSFISTGYYILPKWWDAKNELVREEHPMSGEINTDITNRKKEALGGIVQATVEKRKVSARSAKQIATGTNIYEFAEEFIKEVGGKRAGATIDNYRKHLEKVREFRGDDVAIQDITPEFLNGLEAFMRGKGVKRREGTDPSNYIHAVMKTIRRIIKHAMKKKVIGDYPFEEYEMPAATPADKEYLTLAELDLWEKYLEKETRKQRYQVGLYFLFGCYTGLRISDIVSFDITRRVKDKYISLQATKNGSWVAMPIHKRLGRVLTLMKKEPLTLFEKNFHRVLKQICADIGIKKHISPHSARKTFAVTMCLDRGVSSETAATLMGITLDVFVKSYSRITPEKIKAETQQAWAGL